MLHQGQHFSTAHLQRGKNTFDLFLWRFLEETRSTVDRAAAMVTHNVRVIHFARARAEKRGRFHEFIESLSKINRCCCPAKRLVWNRGGNNSRNWREIRSEKRDRQMSVMTSACPHCLQFSSTKSFAFTSE